VNTIRVNRLLRQLLDGNLRQNVFNPAELELLLDFTDHPKIPRRTLRRYQRLIAQRAANGESTVLRLSEFLKADAQSRLQRESRRSQ
jgi:hypothetical protein